MEQAESGQGFSQGEYEVFFKIQKHGSCKRINTLTVLGNTSGMNGIDLLLHKFVATDLQSGSRGNKLSNAKVALVP